MPIMRMVRAGDVSGEAGQGVPLPIIAATSGRKADGINLADLPWDFSRGVGSGDVHRFPLLWVHDLAGRNLPIGVVDVGVGKDGTSLDNSQAIFDPEDEMAVRTERKYRSPVGGLDGFSITWEPVDADGMPSRNSGKKAVANQLLEVSAVPVPLDPQSIQKTERAAMRALRADIDALLDDETDERALPDTGPFGKDCEYESMADCMKETGDMTGCAELLKSTGGDCAKRAKRAADGEKPCCGDIDDKEDDELDVPATAQATADEIVERLLEVLGQKRTTEAEEPMETKASPDPDRTAGAMLAVFDRGSDDADDVREKAYRALLPKYKRLGWEAPEFEPMGTLRALDDENWRALFLSGELQRAGAEFSGRNLTELREIATSLGDAATRLTAMVERATTKDETRAEDPLMALKRHLDAKAKG